MTKAVVIGGGIAGCATALALSGQGHDVTVLEKDGGPLPATPDEAQHDWDRPGIPQSRHAHTFTSRGVNLLLEREPGIYAALLDAGARPMRLGDSMPDSGGEAPDEELNFLACRRRTFEMVLRTQTARRPGVTVRGGVAVQGLELDGSGPGPRRVTGVRTAAGVVSAAVVVDATGRRSRSGGWLAEEGVPQPEDLVHRSLITGYARFYRLRASGLPGPLNRDNAAGTLYDGYAAFLHPADNDTFSISFGVLPDDEALRVLRDPAAFEAAAAVVPYFRPWLAEGVSDPIGDVRVMPFADNTLRGAAVDPEQQPVHGLFRVGDAACVTNPLYGRGVSLGLTSAYLLADVLRRHPVVGQEQSRAAAAAADAHLRPWFEWSARTDQDRIGLWNHTVHAVAPPARPDDDVSTSHMGLAATRDPVVWRFMARAQMSLPPASDGPSPGELRDRVLRACRDIGAVPRPAPDRAGLLAALAAAVPGAPDRLPRAGSPMATPTTTH